MHSINIFEGMVHAIKADHILMWQSLLVYNACLQPQTEATVLVSPSLLQIDTFGKWCRCLHNVCYLKLKKRRYLDKCRLSAPAESTDAPLFLASPDALEVIVVTP